MWLCACGVRGRSNLERESVDVRVLMLCSLQWGCLGMLITEYVPLRPSSRG